MMPSQNFSRQFRRAAAALVPPSRRAALRWWYERATLPPNTAAARFETRIDRVEAFMADGLAFAVLPECRADIECHFGVNEHGAELAAFMHEATRGGLLFDIGANNGLFSVLFCRLAARNRAVAFEPSNLFADRVRRMAALNGIERQLECVPQAVGDCVGSSQMLIDDRGGFVQTAAFAGTEQHQWRAITLCATTVDQQTERVGLPSVIKIDVEGFEWEVLVGASATLKSARPIVCLELHLNYLESRGLDPRALLEMLTSQNYVLFRLSGERTTAEKICRSWASNTHVVARPGETIA